MTCQKWTHLLIAALLLWAPGLFAQQGPGEPQGQQGAGDETRMPGSAPKLTKAPKLVREVQADYPQEAVDKRIEGAVVLRLTIDEAGQVAAVEVVEGLGYGLDEAAVAAVRQFAFEPAEIDGQPASVTLNFTVRFALPIMPADFVGRILDPTTGEGLAGARVTIRYTGKEWDPAPEATATTDDKGTFFFGEVPPGPYAVALSLDEYRDFATDIELPPGELVEVTYKVDAKPENLTGSLFEAGTRKPLGGVEVQILDQNDPDKVLREGYTDANGNFGFRGLVPAPYTLRMRASGYLTAIFDVVVAPNEVTKGSYYLEAEFYDEYTVVTEAKRPRSEVSRQTLRLEESRRIPGTGGDVVRVVQNLPGVARPRALSGAVVVRGSAPQDTKIFIEGDTIPLVYHFAGGPAIINGEMISSIDFYPGNFSARYGRATAGVIDLSTRSPQSDRLRGFAEIDLLDASLILEGPLSENFSLAISGRRSYYDIFLPLILPATGSDIFVAPRYYDYQTWLTYRGLPNHTLELFIYGSDDVLDVILPKDEPQGGSAFQTTGVNFGSAFHRGQIRWLWRPENLPMENRFMASVGFNGTGIEAAENFVFELNFYQSQFRNDFLLKLGEKLQLRTGLDMLLSQVDYDFTFPRFDSGGDRNPQGNGEGRPNFSPDGLIGDESIFEYLPAAYLEATWRPLNGLEIIPGLRADHFGPVHATMFSPRLSSRLRLSDQVTVKGGVGVFTQPPQPGTTDATFGNPDVTYETAYHYAVGSEWRPKDYLEVDATLFYRDIQDIITQTNDIRPDGEPQIWNNDGEGRAYGLELLLRHYPRNRFFGWLAYTLSRSERLNLQTKEWDVYRFDQTHILTLVAGYNLPRNWDVSARFRLVTGNPFTPVSGGVLDVDEDSYRQVFARRNSSRSPAFHQLDLRVDRRFVYDTWILGVYLDVLNVYWAENAEGVRYNYDFSENEPLMGLPILPTLGVNARF